MCICCRYTKFTHSSVKDRTTKTCEVREKRFLVRVFRKGRKIRSTCLILQIRILTCEKLSWQLIRKVKCCFAWKRNLWKNYHFVAVTFITITVTYMTFFYFIHLYLDIVDLCKLKIIHWCKNRYTQYTTGLRAWVISRRCNMLT